MLEYESALTRELPVPAFAAARPGEKGFYCTSGKSGNWQFAGQGRFVLEHERL
jgi:hypothetical protein